MKYPAYLAPLSIVIWGWLNSNFWAAALLLLLLLLSHLSVWRWQISDRQFFRIGDFVSLLIITILIYGYIVQLSDRPIFIVLEWLPVFYAPILYAQLISDRVKLPLGTLFYSLRQPSQPAIHEIDFRLPYSGICLLAAGAANVQTPQYFIAVTLVTVLLLWSIRTLQTSKFLWLLAIGSICFIAFESYQGLYRLQTKVEQQLINWLSDWTPDPFKNTTRIGDIGELKLSDHILFRVKSDKPLLLHQSSYDRYLEGTWYASSAGFKPINLHLLAVAENQLSILQSFHETAILALPPGTVSIAGLEQGFLYSHRLGAVKIDEAPAFADFRVAYSGRFKSPLGKFDLLIPEFHKPWLKKIAHELNLPATPQETAKKITAYFQHNYHYSLYSEKQQHADQALRDFMLNTKSGHCEYYAVATVLLLRYAGIPARLATGFSVDEYNADQQIFVVRGRHAHAWAWAYIDGHWHIVDSTPGQWTQIEREAENFWQPLSDSFSNMAFRLQQWRQQNRQIINNDGILIAAVIGLIFFLLWRLYRLRSQWIRKSAKIPLEYHVQVVQQGMDSEFFLIEQQLNQSLLLKKPGESWQIRINGLADPELTRLWGLHNRYRFDPNGITDTQRMDLKTSVFDWLTKHRNTPHQSDVSIDRGL